MNQRNTALLVCMPKIVDADVEANLLGLDHILDLGTVDGAAGLSWIWREHVNSIVHGSAAHNLTASSRKSRYSRLASSNSESISTCISIVSCINHVLISSYCCMLGKLCYSLELVPKWVNVLPNLGSRNAKAALGKLSDSGNRE